MSISAMLVAGPVPSTALPNANSGGWGAGTMGFGRAGTGMAGLAVECSSRPQKKATAHHRKTRPKKTQPWDVRRKGPTSYPPLPALPPEWTLVSSQEEDGEKAQQEEEVAEGVTSPA